MGYHLRYAYLIQQCLELRHYDEYFISREMTIIEYHSNLMNMDLKQLESLHSLLLAEKEIS